MFVEALISPHWYIIEQLILHTGATVTMPLYPLTPEHTYRETFLLLTEVYRQVLASTPPEKVVLCGDSAGGNLALTQAPPLPRLGVASARTGAAVFPVAEPDDVQPRDCGH